MTDKADIKDIKANAVVDFGDNNYAILMGDKSICVERVILIAAAPELLDALQSIQQSMAKYIEVANNIGVEALADGFYLGHAIDVEEKARQAIAKALGQQ